MKHDPRDFEHILLSSKREVVHSVNTEVPFLVYLLFIVNNNIYCVTVLDDWF